MTQTHDVVVHKANITLADGESVQQFMSKIRDAGKTFVGTKLNLVKNADVYPVEVFSKTIVFDVYQYGPDVPANKRARFFAAAYSRKNDGGFEFTTLTEVERVTVYQPKQNAAVTKSTKGEEVEKAVWTAAFINNLPDAAFAVIMPGGKKDSEGKTVPRSLRMLPHHNGNVKSPAENSSVDLAHLRNALARLPQAKISADAKAKAMAHLQAHAKELLKTTPSKKHLELRDAEGWAMTEKSFWRGLL